jgi:hypothetical protein
MQHLKFFSFVIFSSASIFLQSNILAQQAPHVTWQHCYGGYREEEAHSIIEIKGNILDNYVFAGYTLGPDQGDVTGFHPTPNATNYLYPDAWIVGHDAVGVLWQKCIGGSSGDEAKCILRTFNGNYVVAGFESSNDGDFPQNHGGTSDAWAAKLDPVGNIIWVKSFGGSSDDRVYSIIETNDEARDLVVVGKTVSNDGDVSGWHTGKTMWGSTTYDVWVVMLSSGGAIRWQKCLGGSGEDAAYSIIQTNDGGFLIAGNTNSHDGDVTGCHAGTDRGENTSDAWVVKLDRSGKIKWQKCLGGSGGELAVSIIQTIDNGYAFTGSASSKDGDVSGFHDSLGTDLWFVKLSSDGALETQKCFGGSKIDVGNSIIQLANGNYIIAGETKSTNGDVTNNHSPDGSDAWIMELDNNGVLQWQKCYGGPLAIQSANSIIKNSKGGYIFAGLTGQHDVPPLDDGDALGQHYDGSDAWIVKLDTASLSVDYSSDFISNNVKIYPNPSSLETHFSLNADFSFESIGIFDILGRKYFPNYTLEKNIITCDVHDLPRGIYLARLNVMGATVWSSIERPGTFTLPFLVQH